MKSFAVVFAVLALAAGALAFSPATPALTGFKPAAGLCSGAKLNSACRVARTQTTKMSMAPLAEATQQALLIAGEGMNVSPAAYLAVLLGTFVPVVFLVTLYIQSEVQKGE
jgi:photosystem II PsbM protein